jgi:hypothetical protein
VTDIFEHWKKNRFVIGPNGMFGEPYFVVFTDIDYWLKHLDEMIEWCKDHNCRQTGMTVDIPNSETLTLFCLKWA